MRNNKINGCSYSSFSCIFHGNVHRFTTGWNKINSEARNTKNGLSVHSSCRSRLASVVTLFIFRNEWWFYPTEGDKESVTSYSFWLNTIIRDGYSVFQTRDVGCDDSRLKLEVRLKLMVSDVVSRRLFIEPDIREEMNRQERASLKKKNNRIRNIWLWDSWLYSWADLLPFPHNILIRL